MPGAFAGALALAIVPERATLTILALFLAATGLRVLVGKEPAHKRQERNGRSTVITGGFAGFASALTGTGGPMVLVPLLLWQKMPLLTAVSLGQIAQLPIASVATVGNFLSGGIELLAAPVIGCMCVPWILVGRGGAERVPP